MNQKAYVTDGDLGSGEPGSLRWHKLSVAELSNDERIEYLREALPTLSMDDGLSFVGFLIKEAVAEALENDDGNGSS